MAPLLSSDEELGKRDDDYRPSKSRWGISRQHYRKRRLLLWVVGILALWWLARRYIGSSETSPSFEVVEDEETGEPLGRPPVPVDDDAKERADQYYEGKVRFFRLAETLHEAVQETRGYRGNNRNVLFAVSSLRSASILMPVACEMSTWDRNYVHVVFMGRDPMPLADIKEINGINGDECDAIWHDARADYSKYSTYARAGRSVAAAFNYLEKAVHPQAVITDDLTYEDDFFANMVKSKSKEYRFPVVSVPRGHVETLRWVTRLDSGSLAAWNEASIDILIQPPTKSAGSLIRLLKSLRQADYSGLKPPRLIIELPPEIEHAAEQFLDRFKWPPGTKQQDFTVRHHIPYSHLSPEAASVRWIESFYPSDTTLSHVLVLSSQAEMSPMYFQYLMYNVLEYRYSADGSPEDFYTMGISLEHPSLYLNGTAFQSPSTKDMNDEIKVERYSSLEAPFLWQAPSSAATLYFGDKWAELHSFLTYRISAAGPKTVRDKAISEIFPAWMEYALELMRAHGYMIIYPGVLNDEHMVTVHNDLARIPEEFIPLAKQDEDERDFVEAPVSGESFLRAENAPQLPSRAEPDLVSNALPLHDLLPFNGELPEIPDMAHMLYDGAIDSNERLRGDARYFADQFRKDVGNCKQATPDGQRRVRRIGSAKDLFCNADGSVDEDDWQEDPSPHMSD